MAVKSLFCRHLDTYLQSRTPELSNETRFFQFRPLVDDIEPFEVDLLPVFRQFLRIFVYFSIICLNIEVLSEE